MTKNVLILTILATSTGVLHTLINLVCKIMKPFLAQGLTFDGDVRKTTDAFNLFATLTMAILIICSVMVYRNSESFKAHRNLIFVINCVVLLFILGFLYLVRCCLR